jgi:hypothetical protein
MENIGDSLRKPVRRRSHARRPAPNDCVIDMAEARREIAHALHLRRSLSSSSSAAAAAAAAASCFMNRKPTISGNRNSIFGGSQYCYSVMESMPLPEPIWSTTAPSILAAPAPPAMEAPEFEWGENQASYTWWLGFLKTLDSKLYNEEPRYPFENQELGEPPFLDACDQSCPDEWLMFPTTTEDQGESDSVIPL